MNEIKFAVLILIRFWAFMLQFPCVVFCLFLVPLLLLFHVVFGLIAVIHTACMCACLIRVCVLTYTSIFACVCTWPVRVFLHYLLHCPCSLFLLIVLPLCPCWESGTGACRKSRHLLCKRESKQRDAQTQEVLLPSRGSRLGICHSFAFIIKQKRERRL